MAKPTLTILMKRTKMELDQKRQALAIVKDRLDRLEQDIEDKQKMILDELEAIQDMPDYFYAFTQFRAKTQKSIELDKNEQDKLQTEVEKLLEDIRENYGEMRKLDIAIDQFNLQDKQEEGRKYQRDLDELATTRSARKT